MVIKKLLLFSVVVVTGFASLAAQVIFPRLLHPNFGSSGDVGAAVVACSLAGLALGYWVGGRPNLRPERLLAAGLVTGGTFLVLVSTFASRLGFLAGDLSASQFTTTSGLITASVALAFVPGVAFGLVSTVVLKIVAPPREGYPTETPALVFGLGTLANVVGGLSAGYWLVPFVGLSASLRALGFLMLTLGVLVAFVAHRFAAAPNVGSAEFSSETATSDNALNVGDAETVELGQPVEAISTASDEPVDEMSDPKIWGLVALAFYSGIASLALEVGGSRMLGSYFGPTTALWASVLSVSLGGLAVGYILGGRIKSTQLEMALRIVVVCNSVWFLAAAWIIESAPFELGPGTFSTIMPIATTAFLPAFVLFGLESQIILGLVAVRNRSTLGQSSKVSQASGLVFGASSVGGVLGALTGVVFLLPLIGISNFVRIAAVGYVVFLLAITQSKKLLLGAVAVLLALAPLPDWRWDVFPEYTLLNQGEGRQQTIRIYSDNQKFIQFHLGPTYESRMDINTKEPLFGYAKTILDNAGDVEGKKVLVVGGAGHGIARGFEARGAQVTEVEVDPIVAKVSDDFFGPLKGNVVAADGRKFMANTPDASFDLVIIDAFAGAESVPPHLTTKEFFEEVSRVIGPNGVMQMNMIGHISAPGNESFLVLSSTVAAVFENSVRDGSEGNIILIASNSRVTASLPPLEVLVEPNTDDLNPMEIMTSRSTAFPE